MYADLKENHVLCDMDKNTPTNAESLIYRYNYLFVNHYCFVQQN